MREAFIALIGGLALTLPAFAGSVSVVDAKISKSGDNYRVDATLLHDDTGWDHYANQWEVLAPDGTVLATRVLLHPHENEQPFTRSKGGISIPEDVDEVIIRAHDSVHGYGDETFRLKVPR